MGKKLCQLIQQNARNVAFVTESNVRREKPHKNTYYLFVESERTKSKFDNYHEPTFERRRLYFKNTFVRVKRNRVPNVRIFTQILTGAI